MAFDWTKVDGFSENLTAEEKLALLDNYEPEQAPTPSESAGQNAPPTRGMVSKAQFDKVSSELAAVKKQLRGKLNEDEQRELDRQNEREEMEAELKALRREKSISTYKANFLAQGYEEALAEEAAIATADGDMDTVFASMKKAQMAAEKAMRARLLKETPVPPAGDDVADEAKKQKEAMKLREYFGLKN